VWVGRISQHNARAAFGAALDRCPVPAKPIRSIAVKINICDYRRPDTGAVTDPALLGALLDELRSRHEGARLVIVENDATTLDIRSAYRVLGFERMAAEHGAELHNVAEGGWVRKPVPDGRFLKELEVPAIVEDTDLFVNFAKLKTNALTKTTGCLKNTFALLREKRKVVHHPHIDDVLLDMNKVIRPDVCLVDGMIGMEGITGPAFGRPKRCGLLIGGSNPVSVDACCARIMGFSPRSVRHIRWCHQAGLGSMDYELETDIPEFDYENYRFRFELWEYYLRNMLRKRGGFAT
jgi:uncharacterized protein (DUF362 family)